MLFWVVYNWAHALAHTLVSPIPPSIHLANPPPQITKKKEPPYPQGVILDTKTAVHWEVPTSSRSLGGQAILPKLLWLQLSYCGYLRTCQVWLAVCLLQKDRPSNPLNTLILIPIKPFLTDSVVNIKIRICHNKLNCQLSLLINYSHQ